MLTKRQNLVEVMKGGKPDRFVKQYEAFAMMMKTPITRIKPPVGGEIVNEFLMSTGYLPGAHTQDCPCYDRVLTSQPAWLKNHRA